MNVKHVVIGAIIVVLGVCGAVLSWREWSAYRAGASEPQEITVRQLIERGAAPGHVLLSDFAFIGRKVEGAKEGAPQVRLAYIAQGKVGSEQGTVVFLPLRPKPADDKAAGEPIKVVLKSKHRTSEAELTDLLNNKTKQLDVVVIPNTLTEKQREALAGEAPSGNYTEAIVVEEGYEHGMMMALALSVVSVLFLVLGGFVLVSGLRGEAA